MMAQSNQYITILPDSLVEDEGFTILPLKHPRTGALTQYALSKNRDQLYEIVEHKPEFGSWFIGKEVQSDGSMMMVTPIDAMFLILPHLQAQYTTNMDRFSLLDQILEDDNFPHTRKLCHCTHAVNNLDEVSDVKGGDDYKAYRFSQQKTLKWLQKKTERVADHLENSKSDVSQGAQSASFIRSTLEDFSKEDYLRYAFGLISEYISAELQAKLQDQLQLPEEREIVKEEPPNKIAKKGSSRSTGPLEDYSKSVLTEKQDVQQKLTTIQKKFAKVDKTGMKSITSFFAPKKKT